MEAHEAHEVGDHIAEGGHGARAGETLRREAAIIVGVIAMLLAIASLLGEAATKETINFNVLASDTYSFYQAKNERQNSFRLAADQLEALLAGHSDWAAGARERIDKLIGDYRATAERYESDPKAGDGKKELLAKARGYGLKRDHAQRQDVNYDYARALFQIAIVLGSVSIVSLSRPLLWLGCGLAALAALLTANGLLLLVPLPFE